MSTPDKRTILAAVLYGLSEKPTPWAALPADEQKPFVEASQYLLSASFGVQSSEINRAKLSSDFETAAIVDVPANTAVSVFASILDVL